MAARNARHLGDARTEDVPGLQAEVAGYTLGTAVWQLCACLIRLRLSAACPFL